MASTFINSLFVIFSIFFIGSASQVKICSRIDSIYQFGDSLSDTGNLIRLLSCPADKLPYGITFPGYPSGRWSDGHIIPDYIAMAFNLTLLDPCLEKNYSFNSGANFAVGGATAMETSFFEERNITILNETIPLSVQLKWFQNFLNSTNFNSPTLFERLKRALIVLGEIGVNDINNSINAGKSLLEIATYLPSIIQAIENGIREVIRLGGTQILVPGNVPMGCFSSLLTTYKSDNPSDYDKVGCLKSFNELVELQNSYLQLVVHSLQKEFPNVVIMYVDYYNAIRTVIQRHILNKTSGFGKLSPLAACCGIGGFYNFDSSRPCSDEGVPVCENPNDYLLWDGVHFTQEAHRQVSKIILPKIESKIGCGSHYSK